MITQFLISAMITISPFYPKTPVTEVLKLEAIMDAGEEKRKPISRREHRAKLHRKS